MANEFIQAEQVVFAALGLLEREITLPSLVWRGPGAGGANFMGAKNYTISLQVPAYLQARQRVLDGGRPITVDELTETTVDVRLTHDVYKAIAITDEQLTLKIRDFGQQVLTPVVHAVARGVEDALSDSMLSADYAVEIGADPSDPYLAIVDARTALNKANVPMANRFLAVGSDFENALLKSDRLSKVDTSGTGDALREAVIGRIAGFTAVSHPALEPDIAIAAHQTAWVLAMQAPIVPSGVTWGASETFGGLAMRAIRDYDFLNVQDRLLCDVFVGVSVVEDRGTFGSDGRFEPSVDGDDDLAFIRAVALSL